MPKNLSSYGFAKNYFWKILSEYRHKLGEILD